MFRKQDQSITVLKGKVLVAWTQETDTGDLSASEWKGHPAGLGRGRAAVSLRG